jgi:aspartate ammonia-lyase
MKERARLLRSCPVFVGLSAKTLELIAGIARPFRVAAGSELFSAGDARDAFFLVTSGRIEMRVPSGEAAGQVVVLGPGEGVGEAGLLEPGIHSASARAITDLEVLRIECVSARTRLATDVHCAMELFAAVARVMVRRLQYATARRYGWDQIYRPGATRCEHDLLGERLVPEDALYGVQTLRAAENFPISGVRIAHFPHLIRALAMVKQAAAHTNLRLGLLAEPIAMAISQACTEIINGQWHGHFVVDVIQGGAGTSTNMNANEVIANRALEILGHGRALYQHCHPNNHVNLSQSTNDAYPTAVRIAAVLKIRHLVAALGALKEALSAKADELATVLKMGRTQLQDAVPMTLGQELAAFATTTGEDIDRLEETSRLLLEVNLGGTAIGTGINADPEYPQLVVRELARISGLDLVLAPNLVEATPDTGAFVMFSGVLKRIAVKLSKMCNDLRLLSSGPRCGLNEINLPPMQPGSSIMPGKVNPVIPEVVNQVAFQVVGNDLTITMAAEAGQLQLNVMEPVIAYNLFASLDMMTAAVRTLTERCIVGITANAEHAREMVHRSIGIVTALVPALGYEVASEVAKEALSSGRPVRDIVLARKLLTVEVLDELLSPEAMTQPREVRITHSRQ